MTHDPILRVFSIWGRRITIFVITSTLFSLVAFGWCLSEMNIGMDQWPSALMNSFDFSAQPILSLLLRGCIAIGVLLTTVIYLVVALWWRGRSQVHYQRGGRLIDHRDGGDL